MADDKTKNLKTRWTLDNKPFKRALKGGASAAKRTAGAIKTGFKKAALSMGAQIIAATGVMNAFNALWGVIRDGMNYAFELNKAFTEVNTLFDGAGGLTESTKKAIRAQSDLYGTDQVSNIKAYYDIVSSGFTDQAKALEVLESSNRLAIAGLTSIATAADALTSIMNAYGQETYTAEQASNILFQTVKKGKTKVDELASSIGQVLPIAASVGASFEEVSAALAQMTAGGLSTAESVTQLKGIFNSFIKKETAAANPIIEKMGHNWDVASFKAKGLVGMLESMMSVTGDNTDVIGKLIPNVRALGGILSLTKNQGKDFEEVMKSFGDTSTVINDAMEKVSRTISHKLKVSTTQAKNAWGEFAKAIMGSKIAFQNASKWAAKTATAISKVIKMVAYTGAKLVTGGGFSPKGAAQDIDAEEQQIKKDEAAAEAATKQKSLVTENLEKEKKLYEAKEKLADKIRNLWTTTLDKISQGVKRIREEADKAIEKIKQSFGGRSFAQLGQAKGSLAGNTEAQSAFKDFSSRVDIKSLNANAINQLAQASKGFSELGSEGQNAVELLLSQIKAFKSEVTGEDVFGVVEAVKAGLASDDLSNSLIELFKKSINAQIEDVEVNAKLKEEKLFVEGLKAFSQAQDKVIQEAQKDQELFAKSAEEIKLASDALKEGSEKFLEASQKPINLKLKGDLSKIIDAAQEKSKQNRTANLAGRGGAEQ